MNRWLIILLSIQFLNACESKPSSKIVAKVYDSELTYDDLALELERQRVEKDSQKYADIFINNWISQQVLLNNAKAIQLEELNSIAKKVEDYENQLLIHYYENKVIEERLDTIISDQEINAFFNSHKSDFQLKDYLVKVLYIKVTEDAPELENLGKWYKLRKPTDRQKILEYAGLYASNFYYDTTNWIYFDELTKEIPLSDINKDRFITKKSQVKFTENNFYYFLNILDYKLKNATSPVEFEKDNIKKRILNKRVLDLRDSINQELIQKAYHENAITKY